MELPYPMVLFLNHGNIRCGPTNIEIRNKRIKLKLKMEGITQRCLWPTQHILFQRHCIMISNGCHHSNQRMVSLNSQRMVKENYVSVLILYFLCMLLLYFIILTVVTSPPKYHSTSSFTYPTTSHTVHPTNSFGKTRTYLTWNITPEMQNLKWPGTTDYDSEQASKFFASLVNALKNDE